MASYEFTSLASRFAFGRYRGLTLSDVLDLNPSYIVWCVTSILGIKLYDSAMAEIRAAYPNFIVFQEFESSRQWNLMQEPVIDPDEIVDDYEQDNCSFNDKPTYDRYCGSYAQDVAGYSDDDIDTIFDGDPDAYWNID